MGLAGMLSDHPRGFYSLRPKRRARRGELVERQAQAGRQAMRPAGAAKAGDAEIERDQHGVPSSDLLREIERRGADASDPGLDRELVVEPRRSEVIGGAMADHEHETSLLAHPFLLETGEAQQLGARPLRVFEIVGVIDKAGGVGVLIIDSDGKEMRAVADRAGARRIGRHDAASSSRSEASMSSWALGGLSGVDPGTGSRDRSTSARAAC